MVLDPQMIAVMEKRATLTGGADDLTGLNLDEIRTVYNTERAWWNEIKPEMHEVLTPLLRGRYGKYRYASTNPLT